MSGLAVRTDNTEHFRKLKHMYRPAPINSFYLPEIAVSHGASRITIAVKPAFFHAADAAHGSVDSNLLDDSAFFADNSLVEDAFVLTASFTTHLLRPVSEGTLTATGRVVHAGPLSPSRWSSTAREGRSLAAMGILSPARSG
jgi:uncharacterized protein (TIGR00369 family)